MGFWSTLVHGVTNALGWIGENAGSISKVIGAVVGAAGVRAMTEEEIAAEGNNVLPVLKSHIEAAEKNMKEEADRLFPAPAKARATVNLPALWTTPNSGSASLKVIPEIGMDVNRMLACEGIPTALGTEDPIDAGRTIANQMFVPPPPGVALAPGEFHHNAVDVRVGSSSRISGGIVYYPVPLGNPGSHQAWHSHTRLYYEPSIAEEKALAERKRALAIKRAPANLRAGASYNSTTVTVVWTDSREVDKITSAAVQNLINGSHGRIELPEPAFNDGTKFNYQFRTDVNMGPAEVAGALSTAIENLLPPSENGRVPRMPTVGVSNLVTYVE
ncbi:hypothetical protein SAMD00023353_4301050 [Rosellinia necatrix]|uniref:Uncharacterized protein n=1 Tax=Rosellinia necatrix TaxID=77044 RepID=A0A1W2TNV6_ROSNE|nr:hypothetical protein SAMD00023353_4301050 [Rosellinia necatrix]